MSSIISNAVDPVGPPSPPQSAFDPRLVEVEIALPTGTYTFSEGFNIYATGKRYLSASSATCDLRISNLTPQLRQELITLSSPLLNPRKIINMTLKVGRKSTGLSTIYIGQILLSDVSQPPDITIAFSGLANNFQSGAIQNVEMGASAPISTIAKDIASRGGWQLNNQCTDKNISNFSFTGTPNDGVEALNNMGNVQACVDNGTLIVLDADKALAGAPYLLNANTGMVGIPQISDMGVIVKMMINNEIKLGGNVTIDSKINPATNGTYKILEIQYEIASRDVPFWYTLFCKNTGLYNGSGA